MNQVHRDVELALLKRVPEGLKVCFAHWRFVKAEGLPKSGPLSRTDIFPRLANRGKNGKFKHAGLNFIGPTERGGMTRCEIVVPIIGIDTISSEKSVHYEIQAEGEARCSFSDNFCYRMGRVIALGRALEALAGGRQ